MNNLSFQDSSIENVNTYVQSWVDQLHCVHDDMWWSFCLAAKTIEIFKDESPIGFASINESNQLIRFYVEESNLHLVDQIILEMYEHHLFREAMIGTHDTASLHAVSSFRIKVSPHTLLYELHGHSQLHAEPSVVRAIISDHERIVQYYLEAIEAPIEWLQTYVKERIDKGEFYYLQKGEQIVGSCEVRMHPYSLEHMAIGIAVHPEYRKQGLGTRLLGQAANIALELGKQPICSTETDNQGSIRAIVSNGFISRYQILHCQPNS